MLTVAPSSLLASWGPGSASTKVQFFEHPKFLLQPNQKLLFGKYHGKVCLRDTAITE